MNIKPENLTRALAIITTEPSDREIIFGASSLQVCGQRLHIGCPDHDEVLAVLMAEKEFGFAVSFMEQMLEKLRAMQKVWFDAAQNDQIENIHARKSRMERELSERRLIEVN